jgi:ribonucleotide monophosphatase NagD (HAD superfamily)
MFKGFIFDLDGAIYRSDQFISEADKVIKLFLESGRKGYEVYFVIIDKGGLKKWIG